MMPAFGYIQPGSLEEAVASLQERDSHVLAGGSDLLGCLREEIFPAQKLVSLSGMKGDLTGISRTDAGGLRIGALTTVAEIAHDPLLNAEYPGLARAASDVASPQLRNQGTLGGNLCQKPRCWYYRGDFACLRKGGGRCFAVTGENAFHCIFGGKFCFIVHPSDTAPSLAAFQAEVRITGPDGERTLPVSELHVPPADNPTRETYLEPGEIISAVELPPVDASTYSSYRKIRARKAWDFALAGVALVVNFQDSRVRSARVYLSGAAPVPWRSEAVEEAIMGKRLDAQVIDKASEAVVAGARPLSQNAFKLPLFKGALREELEKAAA